MSGILFACAMIFWSLATGVSYGVFEILFYALTVQVMWKLYTSEKYGE